MNLQPRALMGRLEVLSTRERLMLLVGVPVLLLVLGEFVLFEPARQAAVKSAKETEAGKVELKALSATLDALPTLTTLPAAGQLEQQRAQMQADVDQARRLLAELDQTSNWGTLVRTSASRTQGLALTQLKTFPAELIFSSAMIKAPAASAPTGGRAAAKPASAPTAEPIVALDGVDGIYKHRCELTLEGDLNVLLEYVQTLQRLRGDLRWDRVQVTVGVYPKATAAIALHSLSTRPETPFN